jgi:hypothetical protein
MDILADLKMYGRFAWGLRGFLRRRISLDEARVVVRRRLAEREANFLRLAEKGIFGYPCSPYRSLFKLAGCELGDIREMVRSRGLEETLRALREAGVYVTFEEFKGREPIVRNGHVIPVEARDFDNPFLSHYYHAETGGTTGAGTRVMIDLNHLAAQAHSHMLADDARGILGIPFAIWFDVLPGTGPASILTRLFYGQVPLKWFSLLRSRDLRPWLASVSSLTTQYIVIMGRLCGAPIPWPEPVSLDRAAVVARWAAETLRIHGACVIRTNVSKALRVCLAAQEEGLDLTGTTMVGGGEPATPAKVREMTRTGARWIPGYYFNEAGAVGLGCGRSADCSDVHFLKDALALIQCARQVPGVDVSVDAFHFTTLLPTAPKLMLNVEIEDYGIVENRSCGCPLDSYGFTEHLRQIHSFRKLTGEGVTLVGSEMVSVLEEVLPARFGGSPLDYQLLEEEDDRGFTQLSLLVNPRVKLADETAVVEAVLEALRRNGGAADVAQAIWGKAKTLKVKRMEPFWTARGKLFPLHLVRRVEGSTDSPKASASGS